MTRLARCLALGLALLPAALPATAFAQTPAPPSLPGQGVTVALQDFTGNASDGYLQGVAGVVRGSLVARGSSVATRTQVNEAIGVSPPSSLLDLARRVGQANISHLLQGEVRLLSGQYTLTLTLIEGNTGRSARQERIVHEDDAGPTIASMLDALFAPNAMGPAPEDPEARRRAEEEARQRAEAEARRAAEEEARRRAATPPPATPATPAPPAESRAYDARGPLSLGLALMPGGRISNGRAAPTNLVSRSAPSEPGSAAFLLRAEVGYAIRAVRGLEVVGALGFMTTPSTALFVGGGAQFTFPAAARLPLRGTAGVALGLFQGFSGARVTTLWLNPFVRAEYTFGNSPVAAFAGLSFDIAPAGDGGVTTLTAMLGARVRINP
ncbi:MAG: hypothetical protein U0325_19280 [Polyangiales bacterium]